MARPHRNQEPGLFHLTARGNARAAVFVDDDDRAVYRLRLEWTAYDFGWDVQLWCLMTNHVHLLVATTKPNLSAGMQQLHGRYAQLFNERHARCGHLFGGRFWSKRIESEEQYASTCGYILDNPLAAGLVANRHEWPWLGGSILETNGALAA